MKINSIKISYSTTIPIMSYGVNDKIGVDMEISADGETKDFDLEALVKLHKTEVDAIVRKLYPNVWGDDNYMKAKRAEQTVSQQPTHEEIRIGDIENDIRSCKDLKVLETYRFIAKSKPEFQTAYNETFEKLSNQTK